jgi:molecular chaperone GrpE
MTDSQQPKRDKQTPEAAKSAPGASGNGTSANESSSGESGQERSGREEPASLSLREQLEAARAERDANYNLYLRSQAELQNYQKRVQKEWNELRQYQSLPLARDLLPALDNLHRAVAAAERSKRIDELLEGLRLVNKQIEDALNRHEVVAIDAAGKPFDPNLHQAVQQVPTAEHPPMTVIQEVERGFTLKDRVVRPAVVIVAAPPQEAKHDPSIEAEDPNADL